MGQSRSENRTTRPLEASITLRLAERGVYQSAGMKFLGVLVQTAGSQCWPSAGIIAHLSNPWATDVRVALT